MRVRVPEGLWDPELDAETETDDEGERLAEGEGVLEGEADCDVDGVREAV